MTITTETAPPSKRQRSKAATRALRRRDQRMNHGQDRRGDKETFRRPVSRNSSKGYSRSHMPSLQQGERLWWMIAVPSRDLLRRVPFVMGIMGLTAVGLAGTLWLTTRSTEDAAALSDMRMRTRELHHEQERLERDLEQGQSVTQVARRAGELGMVPAREVTRLVPMPDDTVRVVGDLRPAEGGKEQPLNPEASNAPAPEDPALPPQEHELPPAPDLDPQEDVSSMPAPTLETDLERVHPPADLSAPHSLPQQVNEGRSNQPHVPFIPPALPQVAVRPPAIPVPVSPLITEDAVPPISPAGSQSDVLSSSLPVYTPPPASVSSHRSGGNSVTSPRREESPAEESNVPPVISGGEPVPSEQESNHSEQEQHE